MNFKKLAGGVALSAIASAAIVQQADAQVTTSSIRGQVATESGAPVSGAAVTITHAPSGTTSMATTNASGAFSARGLRVGGPYTVSVSGGEFAPTEINDIYLSLDSTFTLPVTVQGARTMDTVVVTGSRLLTGFGNDGTSTSLGIEALQQVVSVDRDITDAAQLDPFASVNIQSGGSKELSIAGANNRFNSLTIDGVALNDRFGLNANGYPTQRSPISYDAIESLSIQSAPFDVEYNGFTGGSINAVTKSGTNEFHGSAAYYFTDDSLRGDESGDDTLNAEFEEKTYVFTLGGPIIKDKLFFFASYDKYEEQAVLQFGPAGSGAVNERSILQSDIDQVRTIVQDVWGFDIGTFDKEPAEDEKILANIDWNISNDHRAKFTYLKTDGNTIQEQNGNNFVQFANLATSSSWYNRSETVESYIGHVFSDWTPNFSTEFKVAHTDQATGQDSLNGAEFFLGSVNTPSGRIAFGPDRFRHGNELDQEFFTLKLLGQYIVGDHTLKFGYEREDVDIDNLFAQNAEGTYAFANLTDLQNAQATALEYSNAITNDENDLRAIWGYTYNSIYAQDSWEITPSVTIDAGFRYDFYESEGEIRENQNFINRYGFSNAGDIDGLNVFLPRLAITWDVNDDLRVRGGIGRFSGGSPGVWISNNYSNDGVLNDTVEVEWDGSDPATLIDVPTVPDPVFGQYIPQAQLDQLANSATDGDVNALASDFEIPSVTKVNVGAVYSTDVPYLGNDWTFSADYLYQDYENALAWFNQNCRVPVALAPDGQRGVYDCSGAPEALVLGNTDKGSASLFAVSASKDWETNWGDFDLFTSYTYQDIEDVGYGTSSTATSNYSDSARLDLQFPTTGTSNFEVKHQIKLRFNWEKEFFDGYATKASLFATGRSGQPYSYTFSENNNCVFDVGGGRCARESRVDDAGHLLYVPSGPNDPLFAATSFGGDAAAQQAFFDYINNSELAQYRGGVAERNGDTSKWSTIMDLRLQQELPGVLEGHKSFVFLDVENLGNLLNSDWGQITRTEYEYERDVVSAQIVNGQYEYFNLQSPGSINNLERLDRSYYQVQVGVKYEF